MIEIDFFPRRQEKKKKKRERAFPIFSKDNSRSRAKYKTVSTLTHKKTTFLNNFPLPLFRKTKGKKSYKRSIKEEVN